MRMKFRIIWLWVTFATLVILPGYIGWYARENRNSELSEKYTDSAEALRSKKNYDGAVAVYDFLISHDLDGKGAAVQGKMATEAEMNSWKNKIVNFSSGFVAGNIENSYSLVGCVAGDFLAWGDIRDLLRNSYRYYQGEEIDRLNATLAGIGLATTLAPYADVGVSVCKNLAKFMTTAVRKFVLLLVEEGMKLRQFDRITDFMTGVARTHRIIGGGIVDIFQLSKDSRQLRSFMEIFKMQGKSAYAAMMIGGKGMIGFLETATNLGKSLAGESGRRIMKFALHYPGLAARMLKITKKVGWDNLDVTLVAMTELLANVPLRYAVGSGLILWLWIHLFEIVSGLVYFLIGVRQQPSAA